MTQFTAAPMSRLVNIDPATTPPRKILDVPDPAPQLCRMLFVIVTRRENRATSWRGVSLALSSGVLLAMAQIALFDLARYALTGTWNGFQL